MSNRDHRTEPVGRAPKAPMRTVDTLTKLAGRDAAHLARLTAQRLDPGYAAQARRNRNRPPRRLSVVVAWLIPALIVIGLIIGTAARTQQVQSRSTDRARTALLTDVSNAAVRVADLEAQLTDVAAKVRSEQALAARPGPLAEMTGAEMAAALVPVSGPGLRVVIDPAGRAGLILDRDVQSLVNGLWAAGAEAISVGGVRLRTTTAIRQAGGTILVDNRPALYPMTIEAIADPSDLHTKVISNPGFRRFVALKANDGIAFEVSAQERLDLPAALRGELYYAQPVETDTTPPAEPTLTTETTG